MPKNEKKRHLRTPRRRKPRVAPGGGDVGSKRRVRSSKVDAEILKLVRTGVERFILKQATIVEFFKTMRAVTETENAYSHQLTRSVFLKIVEDAIKKRNLRRSKKT